MANNTESARLRHNVEFSLVMARNTAIDRAITAIADDAWTPVSYPGAVRDPDTGGSLMPKSLKSTTPLSTPTGLPPG